MIHALNILQRFPRKRAHPHSGNSLNLQPADEAFLLAIGATRSHERLERLQTLLDSGAVEQVDLWRLAAKHNLQPLFSYRLRDPRFASMRQPESVDFANETRLQTIARNLALHAELRRIGSVLSSHGIPTAPLKGTALAQRLYRALDARASTDIDLLVPASRHPEARALLLAAGYQPVPAVKPGVKDHPFHGVPLFVIVGGNALVVELHWNLSDPRFISIDHAELWKRIPAPAGQDQPLRELPSEELVIFLAIHCSKHPEGVLRLLTDIDQLIVHEGRRIDWNAVLRYARQWQASDLLYFPLRTAVMLFETPVPAGVLQRLRPRWWKRTLVNRFAGPRIVVNPPEKAYLQDDRFRLAHCLMLQPTTRVIHAYWHYMLMPAAGEHDEASIRLTHRPALSPLVGVGRTVIVLGIAVSEALRGDRWT